MTFKPAIWYPITVVLSAFNLVAVGFTAAEPWHAATHAALALGFGLWAQRLRQGLRGIRLQGGSELQARLDALEDTLEAEVSKLRQELSETHELLDGRERMLAQGRQSGRGGRQRWGPLGATTGTEQAARGSV